MIFPKQYEDSGTHWSWDSDTISKADGFYFQLQSSSFLVGFKILLKVLSCLRALTLKLQMQAIDVIYAYKQVQSVILSFMEMRAKSEDEFSRKPLP